MEIEVQYYFMIYFVVLYVVLIYFPVSKDSNGSRYDDGYD